MQKHGFAETRKGRKQRFRCNKCGAKRNQQKLLEWKIANRESTLIYHRNYQKLHQERYNEHSRRQRLKRKLQLRAKNLAYKHCVLGEKCEHCGSTNNLQKHHPDYSKPLEIVTLCRDCHRAIHGRTLGSKLRQITLQVGEQK
jgi:hypothetical protein